jgi:hypothetical protein
VRKRRFILLGLALLVAVLFFLLPRALRVTVTNTGTAPMRAVRVEVAGKSYELGDIAPGASRGVDVTPGGDAPVELRFTDDRGTQGHWKSGGNLLAPGSHGDLTIFVRDGVIERLKNDTRTGPF